MRATFSGVAQVVSWGLNVLGLFGIPDDLANASNFFGTLQPYASIWWVRLLALVVGVAGLAAIYGRMYATRRSVAQTAGNVAMAKQDSPTVNQNVTSHNQSGGLTAHTVNIGGVERHLDVPEAADLRRQLLELPKDQPIKIESILGDGEALTFASEIIQFLRQNGHRIPPANVSQAVFSGDVPPISYFNGTIRIGRKPR